MRGYEYFDFEEEEGAALNDADTEIYQAAALIETFDSTFVHCRYRWV